MRLRDDGGEKWTGASGMKMTSMAGALTAQTDEVKRGPHTGPIKLPDIG